MALGGVHVAWALVGWRPALLFRLTDVTVPAIVCVSDRAAAVAAMVTESANPSMSFFDMTTSICELHL